MSDPPQRPQRISDAEEELFRIPRGHDGFGISVPHWPFVAIVAILCFTYLVLKLGWP